MEKFRSLANYKGMMSKIAADKGKGGELENARTLTQARAIVWGAKQKSNSCKCNQVGSCRRLKGDKSSHC